MRRTHLVLMYPEVDAVDDRGRPIRVPSDTPLRIRTGVDPLSSTDSAEVRADPGTLREFIVDRPLPAGSWALVELAGREWDVVGEPEPVGESPATRHVTVRIRARAPKGAGQP
ncbi:hypothetical protein [Calidifontibacter indicus]|uniref:hypothetical protein n=1 Tax=Calidifontibacter indicus TaxID=419650 RepID=UPI003D741DED